MGKLAVVLYEAIATLIGAEGLTTSGTKGLGILPHPMS